MFKYYTGVIISFFVFVSQGLAGSPEDPFGAVDTVSVDSILVRPGGTVSVRVSLWNDEVLGSLSVPLTYDTTSLTLTDVSFAGSRGEYLGTKLVNPSSISSIRGHFVVALVRIFETPIPAGSGTIFTLHFQVNSNAPVGSETKIDSLFFPPAGELVLVEANSSARIVPHFKAGKVTIASKNKPPTIKPFAARTIYEGDSLALTIEGFDTDSQTISFAAINSPSGARLTDNQNGTATFRWQPEYVGAQSSAGSPFTITVRASDGVDIAEQPLTITVMNKNRRPVITAPLEVTANAGEELSFVADAIDPDYEQINWSIIGKPNLASFAASNPTSFSWVSKVSDSGIFEVKLVASDNNGLADTQAVTLRINAVDVYTLSLDTVDVYPGDKVTYAVRLKNLLPVSGFNVLVSYDHSAATLLGVSADSTRVEQFEYFTFTPNAGGALGSVRIQGTANITGGGVTPPLASGDGAVAFLRFQITSSVAFAGFSLPVQFKFADGIIGNDNSMSDSVGDKITQGQITYNSGLINIRQVGGIKRGDINLNGLAFEIGDAIYFTNYFIDPFAYPFTIAQYANSDVNDDQIAASISDLVMLINQIVRGGPGRVGSSVSSAEAQILDEHVWDGRNYRIISQENIGGVLARFSVPEGVSPSVTTLQENMSLSYRTENNQLTVLLYSLNANSIPAGDEPLFEVTGVAHEEIAVTSFEVSTGEGLPLAVSMSSSPSDLPSTFTLAQNYPNPFNPSTTIAFSLAEAGKVELVIYNVAGQEIRTLISENLNAGNQSVVWDGRDENGSAVASGVYLYRLTSAGQTQTRKMLLVK